MKTLFSEAIKLKDGILYNLNYHQARVNRTLSKFYGSDIELSVLNGMIPEDKKVGLYKCRVVYGDQINTVEFIPYSFRKINRVGIIKDDHIEYSYKYTDRSRLNELLKKAACDDIIIIRNGSATDSFSANLVFQTGSELYTPDSYLLQGTKRQYLLEKSIIQEKQIHLEDIEKYERIFFINAMIDLDDGISIDIPSLSIL